MSEPTYKPSSSSAPNAVHRLRDRARYDSETVWDIVDENIICHVAFRLPGEESESEEWPVVLPMGVGRIEERIFLHGHLSSRLLKALSEPGCKVCLTFTSIQSLVLARSAFHNSYRYRSCVIFGVASLIPDSAEEDKLAALKAVTNHPFKNLDLPLEEKDRWAGSRKVTDTEWKSTRVVEVSVEMASAKVAVGGPGDDKKDLEDPAVLNGIWAGEIVRKSGYEGVRNSGVGVTAPVPKYVEKLIAEGL